MTPKDFRALCDADQVAGEACMEDSKATSGRSEQVLIDTAISLSLRSALYLCTAEICERLDRLNKQIYMTISEKEYETGEEI